MYVDIVSMQWHQVSASNVRSHLRVLHHQTKSCKSNVQIKHE